MTKGRLIALVVAIVVVVGAAAGVVWWRVKPEPPPTPPATADPVALSVPDAPRKLTIGVLLTLSASPGEGAEWKSAAEGARVAAQRLSMGGIDVTLQAVDDKGTTDGARKAVQKLADAGASGAVVASQGSHLSGAVDAASDTGLPLLFPYLTDSAQLKDNTWATGATDAAIGATLADALKANKVERPLVIDAGGGVPEGIKPAGSLQYASGSDTADLVKHVTGLTSGKKPNDAVLVSGPANTQAVVVKALQGSKIDTPILLTPDATSPAFSSALVDAGGSLSSSLISVGPDWGDAAALGSDASGRAMSSFLTAVRLQAGDADQKTLLGDQAFSEVADTADAASHDAVLALVRAAASARSAKASEVGASVSGLKLGPDQGLAGPSLDFGTKTALNPRSVTVLRSSDQDLGLRPQTGDEPDPRLVWFATPTSK